MGVALKSTSGSDEPLDVEERLELLDQQIERLKVMYEQYFMGIQKMAPGQLHRDLERGIRELTQAQIRNTALRYRFTNLSQKFGSYNTYWRRTMTEIENGRYVRHINRVARQAQRDGTEIPEELLAKMPKRMRDKIVRDREALAARAEREAPKKQVHELAEPSGELDMDAMFSAIVDKKPEPPRPPPPPPPPKPPAPPPPPRKLGPPPGMSEQQARDLHARYVQARKLVGEKTDDVTYDRLMATLHKQAPKIMADHKASGVEFNVVIKDDKVILKAKPKK
ncbi:MAG TPA: MXAN_5187 C-terminal domain-containing protein [Kofleriaceae bacterium]|nr:MXAN_5187 C-terminal domain-containing protein [Kofleriaceae bacterium]